MSRNKISSRRRAEVFERGQNRCAKCGWTPEDGPQRHRRGVPVLCILEIDHIHPVALGGTNALDNLQLLCSHCNASKGANV